jgi:hypothetical protein
VPNPEGLAGSASEPPNVDRLHQEILRCGEDRGRLRDALERFAPDELTLVALLRRAVPTALLDHLGSVPPWSDRPRVLGAVAKNPRASRGLSLKVLPALFWRDLADVASSPWVAPAVRVRAEALLKERLPDLRLGDRVALAKTAPPQVLRELLSDSEIDVCRAALLNARLREDDVLAAIRQEAVKACLIQAVATSHRWRERYAVRLALVLQQRTPLSISLAQITSLVDRDLRAVGAAARLPRVVRAAAEHTLSGRGPGR